MESGLSEFSRSAVHSILAKLINRQPPLVQHAREAKSDQQVRDFVRTELANNPTASHTGLLRQFRDSGQACEQSRFRELFKEVQADLNSTSSSLVLDL